MKGKMAILGLILIFLILNVLDLVLTVMAIENGKGTEANPFMAGLIESGMSQYTAVKISVGIIIALLLFMLYKEHLRAARITAISLVIAYFYQYKDDTNYFQKIATRYTAYGLTPIGSRIYFFDRDDVFYIDLSNYASVNTLISFSVGSYGTITSLAANNYFSICSIRLPSSRQCRWIQIKSCSA